MIMTTPPSPKINPAKLSEYPAFFAVVVRKPETVTTAAPENAPAMEIICKCLEPHISLRDGNLFDFETITFGIINHAGIARKEKTRKAPRQPNSIPKVGTAKPANAVEKGTADCLTAIAIPCLSGATPVDIKVLVAG